MLKLFRNTDSHYHTHKTQLELGLQRHFEKDRNFDKGGRSFYFFDFDDNIAILASTIVIFHKDSGQEVQLSSSEFSEHSRDIGVRGLYGNYEIRWDDRLGSFRNFRDRDLNVVDRLVGRKQYFVQDLQQALGLPEHQWRGPSWHCFYHAVFNLRPISLITARGHHPDTIKEGIRLMVEANHLPHEPNYLSVYPLNFPEMRSRFGGSASVPEMKRFAIRASVEKAFEVYGYNDHHRFGMSDDDPGNIALIIEEMARLKRDYPRVSFFVFETHKGQFLRREIQGGHTLDEVMSGFPQQMELF